MSFSMLHNIYLTLDKIKNFSDRLKTFLGEVSQLFTKHMWLFAIIAAMHHTVKVTEAKFERVSQI